MKVTGNKGVDTTQISQLAKSKAQKTREDIAKETAGKVAMTKPSLGEEKVELSDKVGDYKQIMEIAQNAPDVRADKVASLKAAIQNGTYNVKADVLADKILQEEGLLF